MDFEPVSPGEDAPVGVVDIGSNTLKALLAVRRQDGEVVAMRREAAEVRISGGSWSGKRMLSEAGMEAAIGAIARFLEHFREAGARQVKIVATSAVRDAANGGEFRERVAGLTGLEVEILSGEREALLICRGMRCDPGLRHRQNFDLYDLGGGSLEVIRYREGRVLTAVSLPLGCVRLTERFVEQPAAPLPEGVIGQVAGEVRARLAAAGLHPETAPSETLHVGTGGTFTTARGILAGEAGKDIHHGSPLLQVEDLLRLARVAGALNLEARRRISRMPAGRADVFPVALHTLVEVGRHLGIGTFRHSFHNLRFGLAAEMLDPGTS